MTIEVVNVLLRKDGVKMAIIPKKSKINGGDLILVTDNVSLINKFKKEDKNE